MKATLTAFTLLLALACTARAQTSRPPYEGLPAGALVVETRGLELGGSKGRELVLWMLRPKKEPFQGADDEIYTCPDETRGSHYTGPTRISLVDTATRRVVNTIRVVEEYNDGADEFDVPYSIRPGGFYHVEGVPAGKAGTPQIMWLRDYNGDGRALEFALFDAQACMGLQTALFGYSEKQDRVVQYSVVLRTRDGRRTLTQVFKWVDYLFSKAPTAPGRWEYEVDYRGRAGTLDRYAVRYNPVLEKFAGTVSYTPER